MADDEENNYYNIGNVSYTCTNWAPVLGFAGIVSAVVFSSKFCVVSWLCCHGCVVSSCVVLLLFDDDVDDDNKKPFDLSRTHALTDCH